MIRTRIRQVSRKRAPLLRERRKRLAEMREEDPTCKRCGRWCHADGNERLMRSQGGSITDRENIDLLCRECHDWVTDNPRAAAEAGFRVSRKWGVQ